MSDEPKIVTSFIDQNPAQLNPSSQDFLNKKRSLVEKILATFIDLLPSNYLSETVGPHYTTQYQAIAEQLAILQITFQESLKDLDFDFTRSEYLYQFIGSLVFPDPDETGYPTLDGDITFRTFLANMVKLLVQGSKPDVVLAGIKLLTDANIEILEKAVVSRGVPGAAWGFDEQFEFEINVSVDGGTAFPSDPFTLQDNVEIVLRALKPAHTLFQYRHLFRESFGTLFVEEVSFEFTDAYYDDIRKFCEGARDVRGGERLTVGGAGSGLISTDIFEDLGVDFVASGVRGGQVLVLVTGDLQQAFEVVQVIDTQHLKILPVFSAGFSGAAWVILTSAGGDTLSDRRLFSDVTRDFSALSVGAVLTILPAAMAEAGSVTQNSTTVEDLTTNFIALGIKEGDVFRVASGPNAGDRVVKSITDGQHLEVYVVFAATETPVVWQIFSPNTGHYQVREVLSIPLPEDPVSRFYQTSPTGLTGNLVVEGGVFTDSSVDFSAAVAGEILTLQEGPNAGDYRLKTLTGNDGGPIGTAVGPGNSVIPAPCLLRLDRRMPEEAIGQAYSVTVDRLGVKQPKQVFGEDVSLYFTL